MKPPEEIQVIISDSLDNHFTSWFCMVVAFMYIVFTYFRGRIGRRTTAGISTVL